MTWPGLPLFAGGLSKERNGPFRRKWLRLFVSGSLESPFDRFFIIFAVCVIICFSNFRGAPMLKEYAEWPYLNSFKSAFFFFLKYFWTKFSLTPALYLVGSPVLMTSEEGVNVHGKWYSLYLHLSNSFLVPVYCIVFISGLRRGCLMLCLFYPPK